MSPQGSVAPDRIVLQADREHGGIRLAVPFIMLVMGAASFLWVDSLLLAPLLGRGDWADARPLLRVALSIALGLASGGMAEAILKRTWGSGRLLCLDSGGLTTEEKGAQPERIEWAERVNASRWRYALRGYPRGGRERRVPTGHLLVACRLLQDDCTVTVHCYLSPKRAERLPGYAQFVELNMGDLHRSNSSVRLGRPERPSMSHTLLAGRNSQLWAAEKERWTTGFELEPRDFATLLDALERHAAAPS
jgi:hypothetical protein